MERPPYSIGERLLLDLNGTDRLQATVVEIKSFTLSCVVLVQIQYDELPALCILKAYDRRFAAQLRKDEDAGLWNTAAEERYRDFVATGQADELFDQWSRESREDVYWEGPTQDMSDAAHLETYLQFLAWKSYDVEMHAYDLLRDMQGSDIPRLFADIRLDFSASSAQTLSSERLTACPGMLMEYVNGFPLTDLTTHVDKSQWSLICDKAIQIIERVGDRGVCNRDVRTRSFIVREHETSYLVAMVDFGLCFFRDQARDDAEFEEWQADQDEEGAVGLIMQKKLNGAFVYRRSDRSEERLQRYKTEC